MAGEQQYGSIGYSFHWPKEQREYEPEMLRRAGELARRVRGIADPVQKMGAIREAVRDLYSDTIQTWATWDSRAALLTGSEPDERILVHPAEDKVLGEWLCANIEQNRTTLFLVPLISWESPELPNQRVEISKQNLQDLLAEAGLTQP
jgi:hypothetical protein